MTDKELIDETIELLTKGKEEAKKLIIHDGEITDFGFICLFFTYFSIILYTLDHIKEIGYNIKRP